MVGSEKSLEGMWNHRSSEAEVDYLKKHNIAKLVGLATTELTQERPENPLVWLADRLEGAAKGELPRAERYLRSTNVVGVIDRAVRDLAGSRPEDPFHYLGTALRKAAGDSDGKKATAPPPIAPGSASPKGRPPPSPPSGRKSPSAQRRVSFFAQGSDEGDAPCSAEEVPEVPPRVRAPSFHNPTNTNSLAAGISSHLRVNYGGVDQRLREIEAFLDELKSHLIRDTHSDSIKGSLEKFVKRMSENKVAASMRQRAMSTPIRRLSSPRGSADGRAGSASPVEGRRGSDTPTADLSGKPQSKFGSREAAKQAARTPAERAVADFSMTSMGEVVSDMTATPCDGPLRGDVGTSESCASETPITADLARADTRDVEGESEEPLVGHDEASSTPGEDSLEQEGSGEVPADLGEGVLTTLGILRDTLLSCGRGTVSVSVMVAEQSNREDFAKVIDQYKSLAHLTKSKYTDNMPKGLPNSPSLSFRCASDEGDEQEEDIDLTDVELDFVKFPVRTRHDDFRQLTTETHILMWAKLQVKKEATAITDRQEFEIFVNLVGSYTYSTLYKGDGELQKGNARYEVVPSFGQLVNVLSPEDHKNLCNLERVIVSNYLKNAIHDFKLSLVRVAEHLIHTVIQGEFMHDINRRISRSKTKSHLQWLPFSEGADDREKKERRKSHADISKVRAEEVDPPLMTTRRQSAAV